MWVKVEGRERFWKKDKEEGGEKRTRASGLDFLSLERRLRPSERDEDREVCEQG